MIKTCQKCGHQNAMATGDQLEACPSCNAIYSRVELAITEGRASPFVQRKAQPAMAIKRVERPFIETLRENGHYPTFRSVIGVFALLGYLFSILIFAGIMLSGVPVQFKIIGAAVAILVVAISKFLKEASLMLADLSDAAVVIAENSQPK